MIESLSTVTYTTRGERATAQARPGAASRFDRNTLGLCGFEITLCRPKRKLLQFKCKPSHSWPSAVSPRFLDLRLDCHVIQSLKSDARFIQLEVIADVVYQYFRSFRVQWNSTN
jgi:hypothetical protein